MVHWDGYTIFSVISGIALVVMAILPGLKPSTRIIYVLAGAALAYYGYYAAKQTTGTYYFPVYIFILPFVALINVIRVIATSGGSAKVGPAVGGVSPTAPPTSAYPGSVAPPPPPTAPAAYPSSVAAPPPPVAPATYPSVTTPAAPSPPSTPTSAPVSSPPVPKLKGKLAK
jgi:hypothetical protein